MATRSTLWNNNNGTRPGGTTGLLIKHPRYAMAFYLGTCLTKQGRVAKENPISTRQKNRPDGHGNAAGLLEGGLDCNVMAGAMAPTLPAPLSAGRRRDTATTTIDGGCPSKSISIGARGGHHTRLARAIPVLAVLALSLACAACLSLTAHRLDAAPLIGNGRYLQRLRERRWSSQLAPGGGGVFATAATTEREDPDDACEPWSVPEGPQRCDYVRARPDACYPDGGAQLYIVAHYCALGGRGLAPWAVMALLAALIFGFLLTAATRFFCPALEIVADHLQLPPAVAGATLLALGNGAPDTFTMMAVVRSEHPGAVGIAVTEPVGGGLFVTNVVLAAVVYVSRQTMAQSLAAAAAAAAAAGAAPAAAAPAPATATTTLAATAAAPEAAAGNLTMTALAAAAPVAAAAASAATLRTPAAGGHAPLPPPVVLEASLRLPLRRSTFVKDAGFLLLGVATALLIVHDHVVAWGEGAALVALYGAYVVLTLVLSRGDEPVHAEAERREVPLLGEGMLGVEGESLFGGRGGGAGGPGGAGHGGGASSSSSWSTVSSDSALLRGEEAGGGGDAHARSVEAANGAAADAEGSGQAAGDEEQGLPVARGGGRRPRPKSAAAAVEAASAAAAAAAEAAAAAAAAGPPLSSAMSRRTTGASSSGGGLALENRWVDAARAVLQATRQDKEERRQQQLALATSGVTAAMAAAAAAARGSSSGGGGGGGGGGAEIQQPRQPQILLQRSDSLSPAHPLIASGGGGGAGGGGGSGGGGSGTRPTSATLAAAHSAASVAAAAVAAAAAASAAQPAPRRATVVVPSPLLLRRAPSSVARGGGGGAGTGGGAHHGTTGATAAAAAAAVAATAAATAATAVAEAEAQAHAEAERLRQRVASLQGRVREVEYRLAAYEGPPPKPPPPPVGPGAGALPLRAPRRWMPGLSAWASSLLCHLGLAAPPPPALLNGADGDAHHRHTSSHGHSHRHRQPLLPAAGEEGGEAEGEGAAGPLDADAEAGNGGGGGGGSLPFDHHHPHSHRHQYHHHSQSQSQLQQQEDHQPPRQLPSLMFLVGQPFLWLLSLTMPRVGAAREHRHPRWKAALLPITAPLTVAAAYGLLPSIGPSGLLYGAAAGLIGAGCLAAVYPRDHVPREPLKGAFAAATFALSVVWLNVAASALVGLAVAAGHILGLSPGLLGATVLSWGNSAPDLVGDVALARDGYPTMAVAACFASPLFSLLAGMGSALAYGASMHEGTLSLPPGNGALVLMYGALAAGLVAQLGIAVVAPAVASWLRRRRRPRKQQQLGRGLAVVDVGSGDAGGEEAAADSGDDAADDNVDEGGHAVVRLGWPSSAAGLLTYTAYSVMYILFTAGLI